MVSLSLPRMPGWGKPAARLPGVRGPPPSPSFGLRVLVFVSPVLCALANGGGQKAFSMRSLHNCPVAV